MSSRVIQFLRPTFVALVGFGLVVGISNFSYLGPQPGIEFISPGGLASSDLGDLDLKRIVLPSPDLEPCDVVRLQLTGLSDEKADGVGILQCYCFASPANRAVTGPLERFGRMVRRGPYYGMARPRAVLIGRPQVQGRVARLLVTVIDERSQVQAFSFVLSRQEDAPFEDCWMTEAVFPALSTSKPEQPDPAPTA